MKTTQRFALVAALAFSAVAAQAGQAFTPDQYPPSQPQTDSTLTRAQVVADYQATKAANALPSATSYMDYPSDRQHSASALTRSDVRKEAIAEMKAGELNYGG